VLIACDEAQRRRELVSIKAVMMVTHNIEEAVLMCDRVLVLGAHPGHVVAEVRIPLANPRNRLDGAFQALANEIYSVLTTRIVESIAMRNSTHNGFAQRLPNVSAYRIDGFVDALAANAGDGDAESGLDPAGHHDRQPERADDHDRREDRGQDSGACAAGARGCAVLRRERGAGAGGRRGEETRARVIRTGAM